MLSQSHKLHNKLCFYIQHWKWDTDKQKSRGHKNQPPTSELTSTSPLEKQSVTYLPSARLMERNRGYSSGAGLPCWSSYRKTGARPTSTPSCWMPCWLYMDSRKEWRPALGLMVNRMEKSSGKSPPEGWTSSRHVGWYVSKDHRYLVTKCRCTFLSEVFIALLCFRLIQLLTWELPSITTVFLFKKLLCGCWFIGYLIFLS